MLRNLIFIFRPRQNRQRLDLAFNFSNYSIGRIKEAIFLGVILDEQLRESPCEDQAVESTVYLTNFPDIRHTCVPSLLH